MTRPIIAEIQLVQKNQETISAVRKYNNKKNTVNNKLNTEEINLAGKKKAVYVADHVRASLKKNIIPVTKICQAT